ncbi:hypothetical protein HDU67_006632, partial [Dinochytrium kinnereticum]
MPTLQPLPITTSTTVTPPPLAMSTPAVATVQKKHGDDEEMFRRRRAPSSIYMEAAAVNAVRSLGGDEQVGEKMVDDESAKAGRGKVGRLDILGGGVNVRDSVESSTAPSSISYQGVPSVRSSMASRCVEEVDRNSMSTFIDYGSDACSEYDGDDVRSSIASSNVIGLGRSTSTRSLGVVGRVLSNVSSASSLTHPHPNHHPNGVATGTAALHHHLLQHHPFLRPAGPSLQNAGASSLGGSSSSGSGSSSGYGSSPSSGLAASPSDGA